MTTSDQSDVRCVYFYFFSSTSHLLLEHFDTVERGGRSQSISQGLARATRGKTRGAVTCRFLRPEVPGF